MNVSIEFLKGNCIENAGILMKRHKLPSKIYRDFNKNSIIYMSLPNGSLTTDFPEVIIKQINYIRPKRLVYHIIADYSSSYGFCTCLIYHLLIAENNMKVYKNSTWLPAYLINVTIPSWSGDEYLQIKRFRRGIKCIEFKNLNA